MRSFSKVLRKIPSTKKTYVAIRFKPVTKNYSKEKK